MGVYLGNGFGQFTLNFEQIGTSNRAAITHGFQDAPGTHNVSAAATAWFVALTGTSRPFAAASMSSQWRVAGGHVTIVDEGLPYAFEITTIITGSLTQESLPPNCAILVKKATSLGGRRHRGRMYSPPVQIGEANTSPGGGLESTALAALQTKWTAAFDAVDVSSYPPFLLHSTSEIAPTAVDAWTVEPIIATQRRRMHR